MQSQTGWTADNSGQERQIVWDEENRIKAIADNGAMFNYVYDAGGERVLKSNGGSQSIAVNGSTKGGKSSIGNYTIYVNPFVVVRNSQVTKHFYIESQRIATKLAESNEGLLQTTAGGATVKYSQKQSQLQGSINKLYADLGLETEKVTGTAGNSGNTPPGQSNTHPDNGNNGGGTGTGGTGIGGNGTNNEKFVYFYHPDHLGSSSYITDNNGEVTQHLEYFAFGETFLEEHSNTETTPYLFNGKELDEETGLYYYGARYYSPKENVWASVDEMAEKYPNYSPYAYCANNPIRLVDPDGKEPTPYEAALMAAHAYGGGNVKLSGGWKVSNAGKGIGYINADTGFKSALYERTVSGKTEYTYATGGTDLTSVKDWKNNATQEFGLSEQYDQSVKNAGDLKNVLPKGAELTFTGHSLGGGLAEANAIITGDKAITFNAAGVSIFTSGVSQKSNTLAFIMTTDPLNALQQSSILPTAGRRKQLVAPRSTRGWYNGHSIFSMLDSLKAINDGGGYKMIEVLSKKWSDLFIKH